MVADDARGPALRLPRRALPGRAGDRRAAAGARRRTRRPGRRSMPTRRSPGSSSGPGWRWPRARQQALARGARLQGAGDHRRPRRRQDHAGQLDPEDPARQGRRDRALRADRSRRQAPVREHRARGEDHPPPAGDRSEDRRLPARRGAAARLRSAGGRRDLDGGRAADARAAAGAAGARRRCCSSAMSISCPRSGRGRCWPTSSPRARCRSCA